MLKRWIRYYWSASTHRKVTNPFVRQWIKEVLEDQRNYYAFNQAEGIRLRMQASPKQITVNDLGAGSKKMSGQQRKISDIAKYSASAAKKGRLLFKTLLWHPAPYKIELGTSLGIGSIYQYFPNTKHQLYTIEGCPNIASIAKENFKRLGMSNIHALQGNFDDILPNLLKQLPRLDYVFIDGNHTSEATLRYFECCLPYCHEDTILIFDDIHWSDDMEKAWDTIVQHDKVRLSIDVWDIGLVFFKRMEKEHYTLISSSYKW